MTTRKYDAQSGRIAVWRITAAATMPMRVEYSALVVMCALRILHAAVYYQLESSLSSGSQMLLTHLPYVLVPALCVLGHLWLQRYHKYRSLAWQADEQAQVITKSADVPCLVSPTETHVRRILTAVGGGIVMFALAVILAIGSGVGGDSTLDMINRIMTILVAAAYFALVALCLHALKQQRASTSAASVTKFNQPSETTATATDSRAKTPFVQPASHVWAALQFVAVTAAVCGVVLIVSVILDSASTSMATRALNAAYFSADLAWLASLLVFWYLLRRAELRRQAHFLGTMRSSASADQIEMNPLHAHTAGWHQSSSPDQSSDDDSDSDVVSSTHDDDNSSTGGGGVHDSISDATRSNASASVVSLSPVQLVEHHTATRPSSPPMSPLQMAAAAAATTADRVVAPPPPSIFGAADDGDVDDLFGEPTGLASTDHQRRMHQWMLVSPTRPEDGIWGTTQKRAVRSVPLRGGSQRTAQLRDSNAIEMVSSPSVTPAALTSIIPPPLPSERIASPRLPPPLPASLVAAADGTSSPSQLTPGSMRPTLSRGPVSLSSLVLGNLQDDADGRRTPLHIDEDSHTEGGVSSDSTPRGDSRSISSKKKKKTKKKALSPKLPARTSPSTAGVVAGAVSAIPASAAWTAESAPPIPAASATRDRRSLRMMQLVPEPTTSAVPRVTTSPIMRPTTEDRSDSSCASPPPISSSPSMAPSLTAWSASPPLLPSSRRTPSSVSRRLTSSCSVMSSPSAADDESSVITTDGRDASHALINPALPSRRAMRMAEMSANVSTDSITPTGTGPAASVGRLARPRSIQQ